MSLPHVSAYAYLRHVCHVFSPHVSAHAYLLHACHVSSLRVSVHADLQHACPVSSLRVSAHAYLLHVCPVSSLRVSAHAYLLHVCPVFYGYPHVSFHVMIFLGRGIGFFSKNDQLLHVNLCVMPSRVLMNLHLFHLETIS